MKGLRLIFSLSMELLLGLCGIFNLYHLHSRTVSMSTGHPPLHDGTQLIISSIVQSNTTTVKYYTKITSIGLKSIIRLIMYKTCD